MDDQEVLVRNIAECGGMRGGPRTKGFSGGGITEMKPRKLKMVIDN
jgi:hypothetical protein